MQRFHMNPQLLPTVIAWNEEICRYMIICGHQYVAIPEFSFHLNQEQMNKVRMEKAAWGGMGPHETA